MKRMLACLAALIILTGCGTKPFARELEETALVQVLGVDWLKGWVQLTAACAAGADGTPGVVLSAGGVDFESACAALQASGEEYVSLTHVTQIVLGEETDLTEVLRAALNEPALSQKATVWAADGGARELMEGVGGGAKRLSSIELNSGVEPVTVLQSRMRLEERGWVAIPVIRNDGGVLQSAGILTITG